MASSTIIVFDNGNSEKKPRIVLFELPNRRLSLWLTGLTDQLKYQVQYYPSNVFQIEALPVVQHHNSLTALMHADPDIVALFMQIVALRVSWWV